MALVAFGRATLAAFQVGGAVAVHNISGWHLVRGPRIIVSGVGARRQVARVPDVIAGAVAPMREVAF